MMPIAIQIRPNILILYFYNFDILIDIIFSIILDITKNRSHIDYLFLLLINCNTSPLLVYILTTVFELTS